jgi:hypothetical protein
VFKGPTTAAARCTRARTKAAQPSGMPATAAMKGCLSRAAALGLLVGSFTRQAATKLLKSSEKGPSSTGGGFCAERRYR